MDGQRRSGPAFGCLLMFAALAAVAAIVVVLAALAVK